jgi:hypothetical protein
VIVRIVRGRLAPGGLAQARASLANAGLLPADSRPGLVRSHLAAREVGGELELVSFDFWTAAEDLETAELSRQPSPVAVLSELSGRVETAHFEIDEMILRAASEDIAAIRLTVGRFSRPGSDIEMMQLLRGRVPTLGPEMTESYVGRRIAGRAVEVTFITAWVAEPRSRPLDAPLWPDISIRYDEFMIAIYAPISRAPRAAA